MRLRELINELERLPPDLVMLAGFANFRRWGERTFAASLHDDVRVADSLRDARACLPREQDPMGNAESFFVLVEADTQLGESGDRLTPLMLRALVRVSSRATDEKGREP